MKNKLLLLGIAASLFASAGAQAQTTFGLTSDNRIFVMANVNAPSAITALDTVSGMASGQTLVAIKFNAANGMLYGLGYNAGSTNAQLYTISTTATSGMYMATALSSSTVSLNLGSGNSVGFDFISTFSNQIKVVGTNGNTYTISATDGSVLSTGTTSPAYATGDLHSGTTAAVGATAYTNGFYGADAMSEFGYDLNNNDIVRFDSTDFTTLHTVGAFGLTLALGSAVGMDTWYDTGAHINHIYMVATGITGGSMLYEVNRTTGIAANIGVIGSGSITVRDIAVQRMHDTTALSGHLMAALSLNMRNLELFDANNPGTIRNVISISGVTSGQTMMAIDFRPANLMLYGLGYNATSKAYQIYTINMSTGAATAVNSTPFNLDLGSTANGNVAFNFDPVTDMIRVIGTSSSSANVNVQIYPTTGAVAATDSSIMYMSGDVNAGMTANLGSVAYTNGYNNAKSTQQIGIDNTTGAMVMFQAGSSAAMSTLISLTGILDGVLGLGANNNGYIDIYYDSISNSNVGYLATNTYGNADVTDGNYSNFYTLDPSSGSTSKVSSVGPGVPVKSMAVRKDYSGLKASFVNNVTANSNNLLIYPNPTSGEARIVLSNPATTTVYVDIMNMNGQVLRSYEYGVGSYNLDLDISNLPTGYYSAHVMQDGYATQNIKLIKN
ncbi:MAG TPA: DUF4394 domain-containing protein [Flavipsychrobacter sp.]|nr:DUF4394 domain-containing protein [Flavipsychrobacter sp.]